MHNLWLTVVVISCGLRVSSDVIENLKLHEVFRKPKDFSRVNFDHLEILEKNNFKGNHEHDEACGLSKLHPKSVANAQVMLRFGGDDIKGKNCIGKNPSEDLSTRFGVPYCQQCQQPHYQILNQYKPPCQLMPPYPLGQYPVPAYFPLSLPQNPYYPYYCPCFNNVPGMIPNGSLSSAAQNCPFLGGNVQTNIESAINANHPKILQATDLTDECVPENNEADDDDNDDDDDDEPIVVPDVGETFKRPKGYKEPQLSEYEREYEKELGPGADNKPQQPRDDDDYGMDDEPIIIPDVGESFKRPKGYKNPPLSNFEKDYEKQLGPGADNKPKPTTKTDEKPCVAPSHPKGTTNNRRKGKRTNNKNKPNKKPKAQTKPANKPISLKPPSKKDNLEQPTIKEEKPVFDATAKTEQPLFEDTIKTESPIEFPLNTDETIFDQNVKPEDQLDITKETADDKIFIQKIPIPDFECDQQQKPPSVRRELEHWLNKSLVPYECDKCGKKLLVTYPLTEDQPHIHIGGVPLAPSKCPCCQLKGFCDCQTCRSHRDPSIPYGQRFPADVDSLSKMAGDHNDWSPGGYYSDPYRKILFKHPSVFNFITHENVVRREPHVYELVQKEVPKLVPTETFLCCKVPGNRMLCQRQYLAGNEPVLIENGEA